jgi:Fe2+ transport system protein FeoA
VKRDKSQSETDIGRFGSLPGSVGTSETARKLGVIGPTAGHHLVLYHETGGGREPASKLSLNKIVRNQCVAFRRGIACALITRKPGPDEA